MSFPALQTPQRPLPGAFMQTPAPSQFQPAYPPIRQPVFRREPSFTGQQSGGQVQSSIPAQQQRRSSPQSQSVPSQPPQAPQIQQLQPIQRAARTINEVLQKEANFPDLDSYVRQGISSDYDLPSSTTEGPWMPFQRTRMYDIPDKIFEQYNRAEVSTMMGLFADLNHAWVTIDNAIYLWDYTNPNPEIIGHEENNNSITAVRLVVPRPGVFVGTITRLLVVATTAEIILLGVQSIQDAPEVVKVQLYHTGMQLSVRGIDVRIIEGSADTGRIFFAGSMDNEVYELTYQQEEKWFSNRCGRVNHTSPGYTSLIPSTPWVAKSKEYVQDIVVDDTRRLLYTLSSESSIRTFHMDSPTTLQQVIEKRKQECLRDISHMISASPLLTNTMRIVSISPISAKEGSKLHVMATTQTGCRLFLSATRGYGYLSAQGAPQSMQVQHIKFPPRMQQRSTGPSYSTSEPATEIASPSLINTRMGFRYPPGFFFDFITNPERPGLDTLFLSAPDTGRIAAQARDLSTQATKYYERAFWLDLNSQTEAIGLVTKPFSAAQQPLGFGNELAVQYDEPPTELAVLTNTGVHIIRRRRLVDIFAASIRNGGGIEGLENEIKKFIRQYGRGETTATALAVACGQGSDIASGESRIARISDPETLELARKAFVEHGGRPSMNENVVSEGQAVDNVRPSSRHEGLALYIARLVRSLWKAPVIAQTIAPSGVVAILSTVSPSKLTAVQEELMKLATFLDKNKSFIEGLAGPEGLQRASSQQEEIALQGEHQALHSLQKLNSSIIEGISFVQMLFDERVDEIFTSLDDTTKQRLRDLTYELLFSMTTGKDLAKVLVKAIVNRNIANGSNVDTVAEALRRRCGSFCSADDVIIFKAQEQLKKASEVGASSDTGRRLLRESLRLFQQVAGALSFENLDNAVERFTAMQFYAGAIELALMVARENDRGNRALAWVNEGKAADDPRFSAYEFRRRCYDLVHQILQVVDQATSRQPEMIDGRSTMAATLRDEAQAVVNGSDDELFQFDLYDWYLSQGWVDKLLAVDSPFVVAYLRQVSSTNVDRADLLWRFYVHQEDFYNAAIVQLQLAKSDFNLTLERRLGYLSRAKSNASTQSAGIGRQARQVLLYEVSELLEIANIQDELLQRLRGDSRMTEARLPVLEGQLNGQILHLTDLFNEYADPGLYFDICLQIYEVADHRNEADIAGTWDQLISLTIEKIVKNPEATEQPYEGLITAVQDMSRRVNNSENTFNPAIVISQIENFYLSKDNMSISPRNWVVDLFISVNWPYETILGTIANLFYTNAAPMKERRQRSALAYQMFYVCQQWYEDCMRHNTRLFGGEDQAREVDETLKTCIESGLDPNDQENAVELRRKIERYTR